MKAGEFKAKIADYGMDETNSGKPYFFIHFNVEGEGSVKWSGYMTEKTVEKTLETLAKCGLKGDLDTMAMGLIGNALNIEQDYNITVDHQLDKDKKPTKYFQVRFVNLPKREISPEVVERAKSKLSQYQGEWLAMKEKKGITASSTPQVPF